MTLPENNPVPNREDLRRQLVGFMLQTDSFERDFHERASLPLSTDRLFGESTQTEIFQSILRQNYKEIKESLAVIGGIDFPVVDRATGRKGKIRLIGWTGLSPQKPDHHSWQYGPRPEDEIDIDRSYLFSLHSSLGETS